MLFMTFTVLNLFFGLIVNSMQNAAEAENKTLDPKPDSLSLIQTDIKELKTHINELKHLINQR